MVGFLAAVSLAAAVSAVDDRIYAMENSLQAHAIAIHASGINAFDFIARLEDLRKRFGEERDTIAGTDVRRQVDVELLLDGRLIAGEYGPPQHPDGIAEFIMPPGPGAGDPVALYVPSSPAPDGKYALAVVLHGAGETEADVISREAFRQLADAHHAILLAPWAAGDNLWGAQSADEVFASMKMLQDRFTIDPRRTYVVGISMGGAGAFHLAANHPGRFGAILSIIGDINGADGRAVRANLRASNVYLVEGGRDPIMGPAANAYTYATLAKACVPVSLYVAPDAGHSLYGTLSQTQTAWNDMFAGIVRNGSQRECGEQVLGPN